MMKHKGIRLISTLLSVLLLLNMTGGISRAEQKTEEPFDLGSVHHGFRVYQTERIGYKGLDLYFMEHEKTGAQLIYTACSDQERAFGVAFRTQSVNDEGLPHVFEHSALSGSEKYPDSNILFNMMNQTYNAYINAETHQFATMYPIASLSEDQLFADMDLYMDGVLHPMLLQDERAMMREAWHYNLDDPEGEITVSGIVYSEMAANFGLMQYAAGEKLKKLLFPGSYSANCVGGDPAVIPEMTYQELLDFHGKYYHPSNMLLMLYGDFSDIGRFLERLDSEYLSQYDRAEIILDDPDYRPAEGYQELRWQFPAARTAETAGASYIDYAFVLPDLSYEDYALTSVAITSQGLESSPLKQRVQERFPFATLSVTLNDDTARPTMHFSLINAEEEDARIFKAIIDEMIPVIAEQPIDSAVVDSIVSRIQYNNVTARERQHSGVTFFTTAADLWSKTGRADACVEDARIAEHLKEYADNGRISSVIGECLLASPASAMIIAVPEPGLAEKNEAELAQRLADMKAAMTEEEIQALVDECADYNAWIERNQELSLVDQLKVVSAKTLPEEYETAPVSDKTVDGIRYVTSEIPDSEAFEMNIYLDIQGVPFDRLFDAELVFGMLGKARTENFDREALQYEIMSNVYMFGMQADEFHPTDGPAHRYLCLGGCGLNGQIDDTLRLLEEILLRSDLDDYDLIREIAVQNVTLLSVYTNAMPENFAYAIGRAAVDPDYYLGYYIGCSSEFKAYFEKILGMTDGELAELVQRAREVLTLMLNRPGAIVTAIGSAEAVDRCVKGAGDLLSKLGDETREPVDYGAYSTLKGNTALVIDTSVAYNYIFRGTRADDAAMTGRRLVACSIVTDMILIPELRFRGNAYGAYNAIEENVAYLRTYRDPNVTGTFETFRTVPETLRGLELTEEQMDGYISATYSALGAPSGPIARAEKAINDALNHRDPERYLRLIRETKAATPEDIRAAADFYEKIIEEGTLVSVLSEEMLAENPGLFETVLR